MPPPLPTLSFLPVQKNGAVLVDVCVMPTTLPTRKSRGCTTAHCVCACTRPPPLNGKADLTLPVWLAQELDVPKNAVGLLRGASARRKQPRLAARHAAAADWPHRIPPAR